MSFKYKPQAGAGGAHLALFFDLKTFLKLFKVHFLQDKCSRHPTIDLTWLCKNDCDLNIIKIRSPFFFTLTEFIFFIGDFAEHDDDLKVVKSWVPSKIFAPFFNNFRLKFFLICHAWFLLIDRLPSLLIILYS